MTLVQQISLLVIFGFGLALAVMLYRQQHSLNLQQKALRRQRFFLKKDLIVEELLGLSSQKHARQPTGAPSQQTSDREPRLDPKFSAVTKASKSKKEKKPQGVQEALEPTPMEQAKRLPQNTSKNRQSQANGGSLFEEPDGEMPSFSSLLSPSDGVADKFTKYAQWIASNSEQFYFENRSVGLDEETPRYIRALFDQTHLERQNGHWFNLFRSYDHTLAYELLHDETADVAVRFDIAQLSAIKKQGLLLVQEVLESENPRLNRLVVDSGIADFIEYVDEVISAAKILFEKAG